MQHATNVANRMGGSNDANCQLPCEAGTSLALQIACWLPGLVNSVSVLFMYNCVVGGAHATVTCYLADF